MAMLTICTGTLVVDPVAVGGKASLKAWMGRDGTEQHGIGLVADQIMSTSQLTARRRNAAAAA